MTSTGTIEVRQAQIDDLEFMWEMLFYAAHADEQPGATSQSIRTDPDLLPYVEHWKVGIDLGVIVVHDGQRAGAAWLRRFTESEVDLATYVDDRTPELVIAVEPERTGFGYGTRLLEALIRAAENANVPQIVLTARANNPAVRLYTRFGFVEIGRIENRVGTQSLKMLRPASAAHAAAAR